MSNAVVGQVYQTIIEKVIGASKNDFDEFGVDQSTLDEMKQGWQLKLSELKIANFPWDPQPEPQRQPGVVPSQMKSEADVSPAVTGPPNLNFPNVGQNVHIKSEGGYDPPISSYQPAPVTASYPTGYNSDAAQQRAHALVAQRLGQAPPNMQMPHPQHSQGQMHGQQRMMPQAQRPPQPPQQQQQMPQQRPPQGHLYTSQTDGADGALEDWRAFMAARAAADASTDDDGRLAADRMIRTQIEAMAARTDIGLGMPLSQMPRGKKRQAVDRARQSQQAEASSSSSPPVPRVARFDGDDDEDNKDGVADEDAINSDLDDPEDDAAAGDGSDDEMIDYMLCTYDKVQRVKNKWKCTLKDGILTTNKKEYLFHKANGEFEW